jgi:hypothetical protein
VAGFAAGPSTASAYATIARNWASSDATAASAWLMQLPANTSKDAAIVSFSNQVFQDDPQAAYQWAESVGDPNQRQQEVYSLLSRWVRTDPASAAAIVQQSSLSDDQKAQLIQRTNKN